jgi:hypothetical protein
MLMKTTIQTTLISFLVLAACDRAQDSNVDVSAVSEHVAAPRPDDDQRHLVLTVHISQGQVWPSELRLGVGPARAYPDQEAALRLELLDREGAAFAALSVEDPMRVRSYLRDVSAQISDPVEVRSEADAFFVLPLDARLTAVHLLGEGYVAEPIELGANIRELCASDESEACGRYR